MKAVVLAAGKGTRLYPITRHIPKALMPLANKLTIEYVFDRLKEIDATDICLVVGENEAAIKKALGSGKQFGVKLSYARQPEPKGLAHALSFAKSFVRNVDFVLYLGDGLFSPGFRDHADRFQKENCANLNLVQWVDDPRRFGVAELEDDRILRLVEKPTHPRSNYVMAGVYFFRKEIWVAIAKLKPSARGEYEITDAIQALIDDGQKVLAGQYQGKWFDTGTRESFLKASALITQRTNLIHPTSTVSAEIGPDVVIGENAKLRCNGIENSTIHPDADVEVEGSIIDSIIAGNVRSKSDVIGAIRYGDETDAETR
jgi:glucose-1-phosphate thymidylyltransferase